MVTAIAPGVPGAASIGQGPCHLQRLDRVRMGGEFGAKVIIVTGYNPNRPLNCYTGVMEKGHGKEYIFGEKHRPVKIGIVSESHPALLAKAGRTAAKNGAAPPSSDYKRLVGELVRLVEGGDLVNAKVLAAAVKILG